MSSAIARTTRGGGRRASVAVAVAAAVFVLWQLLAVAGPASAHAVLVSSDPQDGSRLTSAPARVTFTFDEAVQLPDDGTAAVSDTGTDAAGGDATLAASGREVVVPLAKGLPDGAYTVSYRVVSADGHVVTGAIRFGVNTAPTAPPHIAAEPADPVQVVANGAQGAVYLGLVLAFGTTFATLALWPGTARRRGAHILRWLGWGLLLGGTMTRLLLAGPVATATGWAGVLGFDGFATTIQETGGIAGMIRAVLLLLLLPWTIRPTRGGPASVSTAAIASIGILATIAVDGHAVTGSDWWLAVPATMLHLAAMAVWVGGLVVLLLLGLRTLGGDDDDRTRMRRWSIVAFSSVCALMLTGEYLAWRQIDPIPSIADTAYGETLLVKLALVALALAIAVVSHRLLVRRSSPTKASGRSRVRIAVGVEAALTITVVLVTTLLVSLPPARTTYGPTTTLTAPAGRESALITISPTHAGPQHITVTLQSPSGAEADAASVHGTLGSDTVAGITVRFAHDSAGSWSADVIAPVAGEWTIQLAIDLGSAGTYATSARYRVWQ